MAFTVRELAELVQGKVQGDAEQVVQAARPLLEAGAGDITFIDDEKYLAHLPSPRPAAVVVHWSVTLDGCALVRVDNPREAFFAIHQALHAPVAALPRGIHPSATIDPSARVAEDAWVAAGVSIGADCVIGARCQVHPGACIGRDCRLGDDVVLYPHVVLYDRCVLGQRVIIHANAVIGADGFAYNSTSGRHIKIPQLGHVEIADDVEIGACATVDRGAFGATRVGAGTKIDNLVMIGHNCQIGRHNLLVSQVGIAGSVTTGDYVVMAGQVGIADHLHIGDRSVLGAKAGIHKDVPHDQRMLGAPATSDREQMRIMMSLEKLPEIRKDIKKIKQQLGLEGQAGASSQRSSPAARSTRTHRGTRAAPPRVQSSAASK